MILSSAAATSPPNGFPHPRFAGYRPAFAAVRPHGQAGGRGLALRKQDSAEKETAISASPLSRQRNFEGVRPLEAAKGRRGRMTFQRHQRRIVGYAIATAVALRARDYAKPADTAQHRASHAATP